ncbi:hypothetical protein F4604DRAFT_1683763 [Suillus subluteus]|nr:hypothetical protein F4604DRAFT_1683763 [Suillus subluteus]
MIADKDLGLCSHCDSRQTQPVLPDQLAKPSSSANITTCSWTPFTDLTGINGAIVAACTEKNKPTIICLPNPVHEVDDRYKAIFMFVSMCFPIFANEQVDKVFGIGAVKITPAHDRNAYEIPICSPLVTEVEVFLQNNQAYKGRRTFDWPQAESSGITGLKTYRTGVSHGNYGGVTDAQPISFKLREKLSMFILQRPV